MIANKYGSLELQIEVPDSTEKHRCQYARDIVAGRDQFTEEMAEDMVIHYFSPTREKESSTVYEMKARLFFDGGSDE